MLSQWFFSYIHAYVMGHSESVTGISGISLNSKGLMVSGHGSRAGHRNCPKNLRLPKYTDMTINWKALDEHFLIVLLAFRFFSGGNHFLKEIKGPGHLNDDNEK
jgi:hypothetical protein